LKLLKKNYTNQIAINSTWRLDFKNYIHKFKKYRDNEVSERKITKLYKKIKQLFSDIKDKFPKPDKKDNPKKEDRKA
jgi:hypothetical protein